MHALVGTLNSVHSDLDVVVVAYIKWRCEVYGVDPVPHFWVVLDHINGGQWQAPAVSYTLKIQGQNTICDAVGQIMPNICGHFKQFYRLQV